MDAGAIQIIAFLIHITHYDPTWVARKERERPFDLALGCEIADEMAKSGFNMLIIDIADGVEYKSHPELKRHYTIPMSDLKKLVDRARSKGIEIVPKLNFSQSSKNQHNHWFRPYNELSDTDEYWKTAFELIDEIISVCKPERFFHIGMDEDTQRTDEQYASAVQRLSEGLKKRNLRTVMWNDTTHLNSSMFGCVKKTLASENSISKDVVQVVWDYGPVRQKVVEGIKDIVKRGFELWIATGRDAQYSSDWKNIALENGCKGMMMTMWAKASGWNCQHFLDAVKNVGSAYTSTTTVKGISSKTAEVKPEEKPKESKIKKVIKEIQGPVLAPNYLKEHSDKQEYLIPPEYYIRNWLILGPFKFDPKNYRGKEQQDVVDDTSFIGIKEDMLAAKKEGTKEYGVQWKKYKSPRDNMFTQVIDPANAYEDMDYALAYFVANVYSPDDVNDYRMYFGSDDYIKVWLNGEMIHCYNKGSRSTMQDDDKVENISLRKGWNTLVVKSVNIISAWEFIARFADENDKPILVTTIE